MMERKSYSKEFKLQVIHELKERKDNRGNTTRPKKIWEKYHLDRPTGYRWVQEYDTYGEWAFESRENALKELMIVKAENAKLRELIKTRGIDVNC